MNHKQLLALFLFLVIIASSAIVSNKKAVIEVKDVTSNTDKFHIENIKENTSTSDINVFYPVTKYENVNNVILKRIDSYINEFNNSTYSGNDKYLEISFETYEYNEFMSFKFNVKSNVGVTHEIEEYFTVVHKNDEIIDINYLRKKQEDVLDILQKECKSKLEENPKIKEYSNKEWLEKGLEAKAENYSNFILTENGLVIIFNGYTVAPFVAGTFEIEIPYKKLNIYVD